MWMPSREARVRYEWRFCSRGGRYILLFVDVPGVTNAYGFSEKFFHN